MADMSYANMSIAPTQPVYEPQPWVDYTPATIATPANANMTSAYTGQPVYGGYERDKILGETTDTGGGGAINDSNRMDPNASVDQNKFWWDAASGWKERENPDDARRREEDRIRGIISGGFNSYRDQMGGLIPGFRDSMNTAKGNLATGYESIYQGLRDASSAGLKNLGIARDQVGARMSESIGDIQNNMRDVIRASQMKLGAMGAGDSSASEVMAPFAYTKLAGEQSASVSNQASQQNFEIDKQENDTKNMFQQLMSQSEQAFIDQTSQVEMKYDSMIKNIEERIATSPLEEAQALASLAQGFASQKIAELSQIAAEDRAMKTKIQEWGTNRVAQLNDYKLQLSGASQFDPRAMAYSELTPFSGGNTTGEGAFLNPQQLKKREDELA